MTHENKNQRRQVRQVLKKILLFLGIHETLMGTVETLKNYFRYRKIFKKNIRCVLEFKKRFNPNVFIETGTYRGDMVEAVKNYFGKIYTIELGEELHKKAQKRFAKDKHIELILGDSGIELPKILSRLNEPAQFWLDAHGSQGETVYGEIFTPIEEELKAILNHSIKNHVILIDDARCFNGKDDYPPLSSIEEIAIKGGYLFEMKNDIIRLYTEQ